MSVSPFDSALYRELFGDAEVARLFSDTAEVRAMMLVLGALAKGAGRARHDPRGQRGLPAPCDDGGADRPGRLAKATGANGVTVPGLVAALRDALQAPEHAQYLHWGATSQDIQDTRPDAADAQALMLIEARIGAALAALADLAEANAETPQAARTYGQVATPSSFGALAASWGSPLLRLHDRLEALRPRVLCVSLSGAAGTASMLGADPDALRAALAEALGLGDPGESWHASRDRIGELAGWLADLTTACGKMGADLTLLTRSEIGEIGLPGAGASSTMPQKQNPVAPSLLVALARFAPAQAAVLQGAAVHAEARDGAAWFAEWLTLPPLTAAAARAISVAGDLAAGLEADGRHGPPSRRPAGPHPCRGAVLRAGPRPRPGRGAGVGQDAGRRGARDRYTAARACGPRASRHALARPLRPRNAGHCAAGGACLRRGRAGPGGQDRGAARRKELTRGIVNPHVSI
jgi:3-carboxy-cis,cis-muconate cycloisomerase